MGRVPRYSGVWNQYQWIERWARNYENFSLNACYGEFPFRVPIILQLSYLIPQQATGLSGSSNRTVKCLSRPTPYADLRIYADLLCDLLSWRRWLRSLFSWQPWDFPWGFLALSFCNDFLVSWVPGFLATWFAGFLGWFTAPQLWMTRVTPERRRVGLALRRWDADGKDEWSIEGATQI